MKIVFWRSAPITADDSRLSAWGDRLSSARVWFKEIALKIDRKSISFSFITYLKWLNGKADNSNVEPRPVNFKWEFSIKLKPSIDNWCKIGSYHAWYDGPHCVYYFGPFQYYTTDNMYCEKCDIDE